MKGKYKRMNTKSPRKNILDLIAGWSLFVIVIGIYAAWRMFDYRAAGLVFSAVCAAIALITALYGLSEIDEEEEAEAAYEEFKLQCRDCGETFGCHFPRNASDDKKEFQLLRRCPICGGELIRVEEKEEASTDAH